METLQLSAKVAMKIALIMGDLQSFEKDGTNKHQNYNYVSIQQVSEDLRGLMSKYKLVCIPQIGAVELSPDNMRYIVTMTFTLIDADSGESLNVPWVSEALTMAGKDDKAIGKAVAYAVKYFLMRLFLASSADDVDNDSHTPPPPQRPAQPAQRPTPPPPAKPANVTPMPPAQPATPEPTPAAEQTVALMEDGTSIPLATDKQKQSISINFQNIGYNDVQEDMAILSVSGGTTTSRKELTESEANHLINLQNIWLRAKGSYGSIWDEHAQTAAAERHSKQRVSNFWELTGAELTSFNNAVTKAKEGKKQEAAS